MISPIGQKEGDDLLCTARTLSKGRLTAWIARRTGHVQRVVPYKILWLNEPRSAYCSLTNDLEHWSEHIEMEWPKACYVLHMNVGLIW